MILTILLETDSVYWLGFTFAINIPNDAIAKPTKSDELSFSPRKVHANIAIWINIVLFITLDSTADSV